MMLLFFIRTFAEFLLGRKKGSAVAWRSSLAPFSFRFARGRERSFRSVWLWFRVTMGVVLRKRPVPAAPRTALLALDDVPDNGEGRQRYVEARTGRPCSFVALNDLAPEYTAQRIGLLIQVGVLYMLLLPLILFGGRRRASIGLIPVDFVRLCLLERALRGGPVREIIWFYGYEKGTALMIWFLIRRRGIQVSVLPSPNPIRTFYSHVVASRFIFTAPFQSDEYRLLRKGWVVGDTVHWPMYRTDQIRLTAGRATVMATVGFISSGNWLRSHIGKNQVGANFDANEEQALGWCNSFARNHQDVSVRIFLHPLEKRPEYLSLSLAHFGRMGFAPGAIMVDTAAGQHPECMDVGVTLYSSALLERLHAGYKGVFAQPGMPADYFMGGSITNIIAHDEAAFHLLLDQVLACPTDRFFELYGLREYRWNYGSASGALIGKQERLPARPLEVSVVIPVYEAEDFVEAAVRSAVERAEVTEVLLVEDGSPDGSLEVCSQLEHEHAKVRLLRHDAGVNRGAAASRNLGVRHATAPFVAFLDADDRYLPNRFSGEREVWSKHPDADGSYGAVGAHFHSPQERVLFDEVFAHTLTTIRRTLPPDNLFPAFIGLAPVLDLGHIHLNGLTLRRSALEKMPFLFRDDITIGEDTEFIIRASAYLRLYPGSIEEPVALRGVHAGNRITRDAAPARSRWIMYGALLEWARAHEVGRVGFRRIGEVYAGYAVKSAAGRIEQREAWSAVRRFPGALKRLDNVEALVDMSFSRMKAISVSLKWLSRVIFKVAWGMRGGPPPEVRASWERLRQRTA
ncbi:MAG: glycosyltransferase family 2 protein [Flavobacteriales bacterium]|nr:glycosyltransferase family 2 protein [Flavobacteriales bacterium]